MRMFSPLLQITTVILLTLAALVATMLATAASRGGGAPAIFRVLRFVGFDKAKARGYAMEAAAMLAIRMPSFSTFRLAGAADFVNELQQKLIDAKALVQSHKTNLQAVKDQSRQAGALTATLLAKTSAGTATEAEQAEQAKAEAAEAAFGPRIAAAEKLVAKAERDVLEIEKELHAEQTRLKDEDKKLAASPSRRIESVEDQAEKWTKDPKAGFEGSDEFFNKVMVYGITGGHAMDPRLKNLAAVRRQAGVAQGGHGPFATIGSDEQAVYSDPNGGFLVPVGIAPGILSVAPEADPLAGLLTQVPMMSPTVSYNARVDKTHTTSVSGGFTVTRRPETVEGAASRQSYEQIVLTANEEFGLAFASERIIADSPQSFVAIIQAGFSDEYVANGMRERINGTGAGERQGFLQSLCKIAVAKEGGQGAATIKKENIDKMVARCWKYDRAVWIGNHNTRPQLKSLVQVVGTGGNAVPYLTRENGVEMLDGRPILFTEFAKTLGTEGDLMLIVPSEYLEGTYQSEQFAESIHVRFTAAERCFRFYRRNDGKVWWTAALTPANGDTLSPVVTLAVRA